MTLEQRMSAGGEISKEFSITAEDTGADNEDRGWRRRWVGRR